MKARVVWVTFGFLCTISSASAAPKETKESAVIKALKKEVVELRLENRLLRLQKLQFKAERDQAMNMLADTRRQTTTLELRWGLPARRITPRISSIGKEESGSSKIYLLLLEPDGPYVMVDGPVIYPSINETLTLQSE